MAKSPTERYADGAELARALRDVTTGASAGPPTQLLAAPAAPLAATRLVETDRPRPVDERRRKRPAWPMYAAAAVAVLLLAGLLIAHPWTDDPGAQDRTAGAKPDTPSASPDSSTSASAEPKTVQVRRSDYVGRPVADVRDDLSGLGLRSTTRTVDNPGQEEAGTVSDLSPTGAVEKSRTITLQVWGEAPPPSVAPTPEPTPSAPADTESAGPASVPPGQDQTSKGAGKSGKGHGQGKGKKGD
jgi:serine/threonine-protein kinase